jgi:hypothetical protein
MRRHLVCTLLLLASHGLATGVPMWDESITYSPQVMRCAERALRDLDRGICHIHHLHLRQRDIPITGGPDADSAATRDYHSFEACHFPHAPVVPSISDEITEWPPKKTEKMFVCTGCRKDQKRWARSHRGSKWADYILAHVNA